MGIPKHILRSSPLLLLPILFLSAATIMLFFCLLAGVTQHNPLNRMWFLQADTSGIPGAPKLSHFTMYNVCDDRNGVNYNCTPTSGHAAHPMLPQTYFHTEENVPRDFLHRPNTYYYLSRFAYAFYIITLFWVLVALVACVAAVVSNFATGLAALLTMAALGSMAFLAAVMTSVYVMAQKAFHDSGRFARVGVKAFAFTWTSLALICLSLLSLLATFLYRRRRGRQPYPSPGQFSTKRDSLSRGLIPRSHHNAYNDLHSDPGNGGTYHEKVNSGDYYRPATSAGPGAAAVAGYPDERGGFRDRSVGEDGGVRRFAGATGGGDYTVPGARGGGTAREGENVHLNTARYPAPPAGTVGRFSDEQVVRNPEAPQEVRAPGN